MFCLRTSPTDLRSYTRVKFIDRGIYTSERTNSSQVDIIGAATATASVTVNASTNVSRHGEYYHHALTAGSTLPVLQNVTNAATQGGSVTTTGALLLPSLTQSLQYDADGNLTNDTVWNYSWDAENRLVRMETLSAPTNGVTRLRLDFGYDWHGRRAIKTVLTNWNGSVYQTTNLTRYVYALSPGPEGGWNLLAELNEGNAPLRTYAWGLDLSGSLEGAGGIGGLLSATHYSLPTLTTHFTAYDGNGNIAALVKTDGTISARYEYGPFGEPIRASGTLAKVHPFRWSTKFWDEETGLVYYGYRYYSPSLGRWVSRDPIEEDGGINLYGFVENEAVSNVDMWGTSKKQKQHIQVTGWENASPEDIKAEIDRLVANGDPKDRAHIKALRAAYKQKIREVHYQNKFNKSKNKGGYATAGGLVVTGAATAAYLVWTKLSVSCELRDVRDATSLGVQIDRGTTAGHAQDFYLHLYSGDTAMAELDAAVYAAMKAGSKLELLIIWDTLQGEMQNYQ